MVLNILTVRNQAELAVLQAPSQPVDVIDDIIDFCDDLIETMHSTENAAGLAAPQVGRNICVFVMLNEVGETFVVINPNILWVDGMDNQLEGCLSIPGFAGKVNRPVCIGVSFYDVDGNKQEMTLSGFEARVFQHEFDHLAGILYATKATALYCKRV